MYSLSTWSCPRNVAKLVQVSAPRYKANRGLTLQQAKATMAAATNHRLSALYVLALYLGLRRGELLGLRWQDVDLDEGKLEVVHTLQRVGGESSSRNCSPYAVDGGHGP